MSNLTPELNLNLAVDDDDTADYLTIALSDTLTVLDGLFNAATGHAHNGSHQGGSLEFLDLTVGEDLTVIGQTDLHGPALLRSNLHVIGTTTLDGATTIGSTLGVTGAVTLSGGLTVTAGGLTVQGNTNVTGNLAVTGTQTTGAVSVNGVLTASGGVNVTGGSLTVNNNIGAIAIRDAGGTPRASIWIDTGNAMVISTGPANTLRYVNGTNSVQYGQYDASGNYIQQAGTMYVGGDAVTTLTAGQTLSNKSLVDPHIVGPSLNFSITGNDLTNYQYAFAGSGALTLPAVGGYKGVFRAVKAWGGNVTINCGTACIIPPGSTGAIVSSFVLQNGDSVTFWSDGGNWWGL